MTMTATHRALLVAASLALGAGTARAQGNLSTQGLGYPTGQLSTQALSSGGALGEFDPLSPLNPAALTRFGRGGLYFQYDPEFRRVSLGGKADNTVTARFPVLSAAIGLGDRTTLGIGASTFLDRSFESSFQGGQRLGPDSVNFTQTYRSRGAINDVRLAGSYSISRQLSVGLGAHVLTGENRVGISRVFADTNRIGTLADTLTFAYTGTAVSGGLTWRPARQFALAASGRVGGTIRSHVSDTTIASASVPNRVGVGFRLDAIDGVTLAASGEWNSWSRLAGLGRSGFAPRDGWDYGVGAEFAGPNVSGAAAGFRLGYRHRTLPFDAAGSQVTENAFAGGLGIPFAAGRAGLDIAIQRAARSSSGLDVKERAWTLSVGLAVRP
jgi:hypothetical protein